MQHTENLIPILVDVALHEKRRALSDIFIILGVCLLLFLALTTGCDTKKENTDASGKDNPETSLPSTETQMTTPSQPQNGAAEEDTSSFPRKRESTELLTAEVDSAGSQDAHKSLSQKQSGIKVTFVELGSVNCIPCKMMQPIMKEIEKEYKDQVTVVFHDVWTEQGRPYVTKYGIRVIPTQVFFDRDGREYFRHEGFFPKEQLVAVLKKQGVR